MKLASTDGFYSHAARPGLYVADLPRHLRVDICHNYRGLLLYNWCEGKEGTICWVWWYRGAGVLWRDAANFHKLHNCFSLKNIAWWERERRKEKNWNKVPVSVLS